MSLFVLKNPSLFCSFYLLLIIWICWISHLYFIPKHLIFSSFESGGFIFKFLILLHSTQWLVSVYVVRKPYNFGWPGTCWEAAGSHKGLIFAISSWKYFVLSLRLFLVKFILWLELLVKVIADHLYISYFHPFLLSLIADAWKIKKPHLC